MHRFRSVGWNIFLGAALSFMAGGSTGHAQSFDRKAIGKSLLMLSISVYTCGEEVRRNAAEAKLTGGTVRDADQIELDNCKSASMERFEQTKNELRQIFATDAVKLNEVREWYDRFSTEFSILWGSGTDAEVVLAQMARENTKLQADLLF